MDPSVKEWATREDGPGVTRMRIPSSMPKPTSKQMMRAPSSMPPSSPQLSTEEMHDLDEFENRRTLSTEEIAQLFIRYAWWCTLAPWNAQRARDPPAIRLVNEVIGEDGERVSDIFVIETRDASGDSTPLQEEEAGQTREHVAWRGHMAASLAREAPWSALALKALGMSPERKWFHAMRKLVPNADAWQQKPDHRQKINFFAQGKYPDQTRSKIAASNAKCRTKWRDFLALMATDPGSLLRTSGDKMPCLFRVLQTRHWVVDDDEWINSDMSPSHWEPGPAPGSSSEDTPDLSYQCESRLITFSGWFAHDSDIPFAVGENMQEFWSVFLVPLICGFVEEYML